MKKNRDHKKTVSWSTNKFNKVIKSCNKNVYVENKSQFSESHWLYEKDEWRISAYTGKCFLTACAKVSWHSSALSSLMWTTESGSQNNRWNFPTQSHNYPRSSAVDLRCISVDCGRTCKLLTECPNTNLFKKKVQIKLDRLQMEAWCCSRFHNIPVEEERWGFKLTYSTGRHRSHYSYDTRPLV